MMTFATEVQSWLTEARKEVRRKRARLTRYRNRLIRTPELEAALARDVERAVASVDRYKRMLKEARKLNN